MLILFFILLFSGILCFVVGGILFIKWDVTDLLDDLSGNKRKRQIEKLRAASVAIGAGYLNDDTRAIFNIADGTANFTKETPLDQEQVPEDNIISNKQEKPLDEEKVRKLQENTINTLKVDSFSKGATKIKVLARHSNLEV